MFSWHQRSVCAATTGSQQHHQATQSVVSVQQLAPEVSSQSFHPASDGDWDNWHPARVVVLRLMSCREATHVLFFVIQRRYDGRSCCFNAGDLRKDWWSTAEDLTHPHPPSATLSSSMTFTSVRFHSHQSTVNDSSLFQIEWSIADTLEMRLMWSLIKCSFIIIMN